MGGLYPRYHIEGDTWRVLLTRHFCNSLSVYLFFEPELGKSGKFNNQGMKEYKARIAFVNQKQLKGRQALHRIFLKPQYKVYRGLSILYFNTSFSDVPFFFQNISTSRLEPINGKQCCLTFLSFKISLEANKD